jgi:hypothetical protein
LRLARKLNDKSGRTVRYGRVHRPALSPLKTMPQPPLASAGWQSFALMRILAPTNLNSAGLQE